MNDRLYFESELKKLNLQKNGLDKKYNSLSLARILSFVVCGVGLSILLINKDKNGILIAGAGFLTFLLFVLAHADLVKKRDLITCRIELFQEYMQRMEGDWKTLPITGVEFLHKQATVAADLDLFGNASLYQYICVANTPWGTKELAKRLSSDEPKSTYIQEQQEALKDLIQSKEFSFDFLSHSKMFRKNHNQTATDGTDALLLNAENEQPSYEGMIKSLAWLLPVLTIGAVLLAIFHVVPPQIPFIFMVVQWLMAILNIPKTGQFLRILSQVKTELEAYEQLFALLEKQEFHSPLLQSIKLELCNKTGASKAIRKLNRIIAYTTFRENFISSLIISGLFMWDYHCLMAFDHWKQSYGRSMRTWFESIGTVEALLSLATIAFVKENYCFPRIIDSHQPQLQATGIMHPLIQESVSISNGIQMKAKTCIITGSNMSGKTTFLRTLGVNVILCNAGGVVCANNFEASTMAVFTSMRIQDDVNQGISTFYAELIRIKAMVEYSKLKKAMLILIDEIFRGTNSADRVTGAKATIQKLTKSWVNAIVSTHDFELCQLEKDDPTHIINYHFDEYYENNQIKFDYTIKAGKSTSTNAHYLMKMAGVI